MADRLLYVRDLSVSIASKELFSSVNFEVYPYDCIGFLGPNGSGKTTFFKMLLGERPPGLGELRLKEGLRMRYLEQKMVRDEKMTVQEFFEHITSPESINSPSARTRFTPGCRSLVVPYNFRRTSSLSYS